MLAASAVTVKLTAPQDNSDAMVKWQKEMRREERLYYLRRRVAMADNAGK